MSATTSIPEPLWRVGARFLRLVLILDAVIIAGVVGWAGLGASISAEAVERGIWIVCGVVAGLWLIHLVTVNGFGQSLPGGQFGPLVYDAQRYRMSPESSFETTWLALTVLATLSLVALALRAVAQ